MTVTNPKFEDDTTGWGSDVYSMSDTELDEALHLALGWTRDCEWQDVDGGKHLGWQHNEPRRSEVWFHDFPPHKFASDGNAMLALVEQMRERGFRCHMGLDSAYGTKLEWLVQFGFGTDVRDRGKFIVEQSVQPPDSLPRAVAEAALLAIRAEGTDA